MPRRRVFLALWGAAVLYGLIPGPGLVRSETGGRAVGAFRLTAVGAGEHALAPGERGQLALALLVPGGLYIAPPGGLSGTPATRLRLTPPRGVTISRVSWPPAGRAPFPGRAGQVPAYSGPVFIRIHFRVQSQAAAGQRAWGVVLTTRPWTRTKIMPGVRLTVSAPIRIKPVPASSRAVRTARAPRASSTEPGVGRRVAEPTRTGPVWVALGRFQPPPPRAAAPPPETPAGSTWDEKLAAWLSGTIKSKGLWLTLVALFVIGLALNLTPCVFPLIPITVSYFAGQEKGRRGRLLIHGALYMLGLALTFSAFGGLLAVTGKSLGNVLEHPVVLVLLAGLMVALALSMFGLWEIRLPVKLTTWAGQSRTGYGGTLFMGLVIGLLATPCLSPVLIGLGAWVAQRQSVSYGMLTFFVLALGMGLPLAVLAVFSTRIDRLPRSGAWMSWVRKVFGCVLLALALFYIQGLLPAAAVPWVVLVMGVLTGLWLTVFDRTDFRSRAFKVVKYVVATAVVLVAAFVFWQTVHRLPWRDYRPGDLTAGRSLARPVMVFVTTPGCGPCEQMKLLTFPRPRVRRLARAFELIQLDLGRIPAAAKPALLRRLRLRKTPTTMFLDRQGREIERLRLAGFKTARVLLIHMRAALKSGAAGGGSGPVSRPRWMAFRPGDLSAARPHRHPVMVLFTRKGCLPCDRFKAEFQAALALQPRVAALAGRFRLIEVDLTGSEGRPEVRQLARRLGGVRQTPTVIIIFRRGERIEGLRMNGYHPPAVLVKNMDAALRAVGRP
ncbi:MAG: thioredoxin fold domain-containing protein [Proteobacteria bacterium]|nr:thioredoxin fold domain-containing protein [Pseudomonadota bacterium]